MQVAQRPSRPVIYPRPAVICSQPSKPPLEQSPAQQSPLESLPEHPSEQPSERPPEPSGPPKGVLGKAIQWLDDYTSPRPNTGGNFKKASYFQAAFQGGSEGFYLMGLPGIAAGASSALTGAFVQNKTGSQVAGLAAGTAVGAALGAGVGALTGLPLQNMALVGGLVGSFQTIRAHGESKIRDSGGNATMVSAFFVPGPAKVAGGIGAAMGARMQSRWSQALVGAATGAALGGALAAVGYAPVSVATAALGSALAGAVGPFIGPRFSQFFRNLAEDLGNGVSKLLVKTGLVDEPLEAKKANAVGSLPASFIKEGMRGFQLSDGGLAGFVVGGLMETAQQAQIALFSKTEDPPSQPPES